MRRVFGPPRVRGGDLRRMLTPAPRECKSGQLQSSRGRRCRAFMGGASRVGLSGASFGDTLADRPRLGASRLRHRRCKTKGRANARPTRLARQSGLCAKAGRRARDHVRTGRRQRLEAASRRARTAPQGSIVRQRGCSAPHAEAAPDTRTAAGRPRRPPAVAGAAALHCQTGRFRSNRKRQAERQAGGRMRAQGLAGTGRRQRQWRRQRAASRASRWPGTW